MGTIDRKTRHRGSALLVAIILVGVMAVVALALISRTNNEMEAVSAKRHYDVAVACADVPMPPWCTSAAQCGSSSLKGANST